MPKRQSLILVFVIALLIIGCGGNDDSSGGRLDDGQFNIVATTGMITDMVENIGGDEVVVAGLMGPGVDPHLYKAGAGDVSLMSYADLIVYNGLHLEGAMTSVFEKMSSKTKTLGLGDQLDPALLIATSESGGLHDPHIWFDVSLWMKTIPIVRDALIEIDPENKALYTANARNYAATLDSLDSYVRSQAEKIPPGQRVLVTAHDAFNYFGRAYGFEVRGLQGISTAAEAGTGDVQELARFIASRKIPALFIETSVPRRNIEAVQAAVRSRGFEVTIGGELFSDAMGNPDTPEGKYVGMVKHNIDTIVNSLLGE